MHDWAISELEIRIGGVVIGEGAFGKVFVGVWRGTKVAVKRLPFTPQAVGSLKPFYDHPFYLT